MNVTIRLFGPAAQVAKTALLVIQTPSPAPTCAQLAQQIAAQCAGLEALLPSLRFAVNCEYVGLEHVIQPDDEVSLIGMVSGG